MSNVWYIGKYTRRTVSASDWTGAGAPGSTVTWGPENGYSIDQSGFTSAQLAVLTADPEFLTGQSGLRPAPLPNANDSSNPNASALVYYQATKDLFNGNSSKINTMLPQRINICGRAKGPYTGMLSDGTKQGMAWLYCLPVDATGHSMEFVFSNIYNNAGIEAPGVNALTFFASLELPQVIGGDSPRIALTPVGGKILQPDEQVILRANVDVTKGDYINLIVQISVDTLGKKWGSGSYIYYTNGSGGHDGVLDTSAAPSTDITMTAAISSFANTFTTGWSPLAVSALVENPTTSILIVGTSIDYGIGNNGGGNDQSFISMALKDAGIPYQNIAMPSSAGFQFSGGPNYRIRRMNAVAGIRHTHAYWGHGPNDLGIPLATIQSRAILGWRFLTAQGMKVIACTILPHPNSGNTVPNANDAYRTGYNNWMRDGAPMNSSYVAQAIGASGPGIMRMNQAGHPLVGYFELADVVESARDSGLWKASPVYSDDKLHPNDAGHIALKAAVDTSKIK